jgi:branched-chain amino acid transport system substrate-binding protein
MRRCDLLLVLSAFMPGGCVDEAPPRIGVIVSASPGQAADVAAAELQPGERGYFEPLIATQAVPASDAEQAIEQAYAFVNDPRVLAVVGHANSASSLAASQIYNAAGIVQIAPTTTAPVYGEAGPFSFRLVPSDTLQAQYLARVRRHHWPDSRVAVVHVNDDYGRGLLRSLRPMLDSVVFEGLYADNGEDNDIVRLSASLIESEAGMLFWIGRPRALRLLLARVRPEMPELVVVCADACDVTPVYRNQDGAFTGIHFVRFMDPVAADTAIVSFQERYHARTGEMASSEAMLTYDAVALIRAALQEGASTRAEVREYLESLGNDRPEFAGLTGRIKFDSSGGFARAYMLAEVRAAGVVPADHAVGHHGQ